MALNDGYQYREQLGAAARGHTALSYLTARYRHSTEATWRERLARREVTLDGAVATGAERLRGGQQLCWARPPWQEDDAPLHFTCVHEDEALVVVVKPSGLPTIPSGGFLQHTLLHLVRQRWPDASPQHRLGRATSGLVLFARGAEAAASLARGWADGTTTKRYRALGAGRAAEDAYDITAPIGLVPHPVLGAVHGASPNGKPARSSARVLERRAAETLFEVDLHSGRSEQIRIHLAAIGHPLAGDPLYAAGGRPRALAPGLPGDGGYLLHATTLAFTHPMSGARLTLHAPAPPALRREGEPG